jgi:hypothetical protein
MPRFDGTGPTGTGPIGRGMGPCGWGYTGGYAGGYAGRGRGRGFFRGNFGWGIAQTDAPQPEIKAAMTQRKAWLENQLAVISQQLQDLDNK